MVNKEQKIAKARDLFLAGYNCAQAVAAAYAPELGLEEEKVRHLIGGFGGGFGGMRMTCGAISGMTMVLGSLCAYDDTEDLEAKKHMYAMVSLACNRFQAEYETLICRELLEKNGIIAKSEPSRRTPDYYVTRPCARYVEACAGIAADIINEEELA